MYGSDEEWLIVSVSTLVDQISGNRAWCRRPGPAVMSRPAPSVMTAEMMQGGNKHTAFCCNMLLPLILLLWHYDPFSCSYGPARFFQTLSNYWIIDILRREAKCSNLERQRARWVIGAFRHDCVTSWRNLNRRCADSNRKYDVNFVSKQSTSL